MGQLGDADGPDHADGDLQPGAARLVAAPAARQVASAKVGVDP
jgi:hypothetical protein